MIKHIVLFQLDSEIPNNVRTEVAQNFKTQIESLPGVIPCIRHIEVGCNVNPAEQWDICLIGEFDSMEELNAYAIHPEHCKVAAMIRPYVKQRSCVDYAL